jgi:mannose-6-phosphate isomerase class I
MNVDASKVEALIKLLILNIEKVFPERINLIIRLYEQFGNDLGIIVSCFLNYFIIPSGKCYAIAAGVPHAYING